MTKFEKGDKITLTVSEVQDSNLGQKVFFEKKNDGHACTTNWLMISRIKIDNHDMSQRALQAGDIVKLKNGQNTRKIVVIIGDLAWVTLSDLDESGGLVQRLDNLERVPVH